MAPFFWTRCIYFVDDDSVDERRSLSYSNVFRFIEKVVDDLYNFNNDNVIIITNLAGKSSRNVGRTSSPILVMLFIDVGENAECSIFVISDGFPALIGYRAGGGCLRVVWRPEVRGQRTDSDPHRIHGRSANCERKVANQ